MVVLFDEKEKNAKLSLRQTEILEKLSKIVDEICSECHDQYALSSRTEVAMAEARY